MNKIKVLLVDDDPVWQAGLASIIQAEPDLQLAGITATKEQAIRAVARTDFDVLLLDMILTPPDFDGIDLAREILYKKPVKIIMLTSVDEAEWVSSAIQAGAYNYVVKTYYKELPSVIRDAYNDHASIHSSAAMQLRREIGRLKRIEGECMISPAEQDVLRLVSQGFSRRQIMQMLFLSESTVKSHIHRISKKIGAKTGKEAATTAKRKGWII